MKWKDKLINDLLLSLTADKVWSNILYESINKDSVSIHLAVFSEPFLTMMFNGEKTMESRFSINKVSPFGKISKGDVVIIKRSGGEIEGACVVGDVFYFSNLTQSKLNEIELSYGKEIGWYSDPHFLKNKASSKYLTLFRIQHFKRLKLFSINKKDRTAWTIIHNKLKDTLFDPKPFNYDQ